MGIRVIWIRAEIKIRRWIILDKERLRKGKIKKSKWNKR